MTVPLECFAENVRFIRVLECGSAYKYMSFNYPIFQLSEHTEAPMSLDKRGSTVP